MSILPHRHRKHLPEPAETPEENYARSMDVAQRAFDGDRPDVAAYVLENSLASHDPVFGPKLRVAETFFLAAATSSPGRQEAARYRRVRTVAYNLRQFGDYSASRRALAIAAETYVAEGKPADAYRVYGELLNLPAAVPAGDAAVVALAQIRQRQVANNTAGAPIFRADSPYFAGCRSMFGIRAVAAPAAPDAPTAPEGPVVG